MSTRKWSFGRSLLLAGALIACGTFAAAQSASVQQLAQRPFMLSDQPALLGPITEVGRKGWECAPERAASSKDWREAGLPEVRSTGTK